LSCDSVRCVRCLSWPSQAADWPTRHRNYDWPDSATVDRVVNNGCDAVQVAHRQCRQNQWMNKHQFRLSFSRAEIVLLNSWMPAQQIVYHILRVFMKAERLTDSADNSGAEGKLSNYHIKTLMLWAGELKPQSWWSDDLSLVRICVELLHNLAIWLTETRCPQYFINCCNLIDSSVNLKQMASGLTSMSKSCLSSWFVSNYIRKCSQLCSRNVSRLFDDVRTIKKLQNAASAIADWRLSNTQLDMRKVVDALHCQMARTVLDTSLTVWSLKWWLTELANICSSLPVYWCIVSVAFLHVARRISSDCLTDELMDVLAVVAGVFIDPRGHSTRRSSRLL